MQLDREEREGSIIITVREPRLDAGMAVEFKDRFRALVGPEAQHAILDLSEVEFLDSSGLGALVTALKFMGEDRRLDLVGLQPLVVKVLTLTRMDRVFSIRPSVQDALAA